MFLATPGLILCYFQHVAFIRLRVVLGLCSSGSLFCFAHSFRPNLSLIDQRRFVFRPDRCKDLLKSWCNKPGILSETVAFYLAIAITFLQGWAWLTFRSVFSLAIVFVKSSMPLYSVQYSDMRLPGRLALPYHSVGRVSHQGWHHSRMYTYKLTRFVPYITFWTVIRLE